MNKITYKKRKDKIVIEIPFWSKRFNPYMLKDNGEPEDVGSYPTLTGLIIKHHKGGNDYDDIGFALTIDMDYKDKPDQWTDIWFQWGDNSEDEIGHFKKLCKKWKIPCVETED